MVVFLVVIWLLLFGVSHFDPPNPGIPTAIFDHFYPVGRFQPDLANEWNLAALQVAVGVLVLLGLGAGRGGGGERRRRGAGGVADLRRASLEAVMTVAAAVLTRGIECECDQGRADSRTLRTLNTLARPAHKLGLETARVLGSGVG